MKPKHYFFIYTLAITLAILLVFLLDRMFVQFLGMKENIYIFWTGWIGYFLGRMDMNIKLRPSIKTYHIYRDNMIAGLIAIIFVGLPCVLYFL